MTNKANYRISGKLAADIEESIKFHNLSRTTYLKTIYECYRSALAHIDELIMLNVRGRDVIRAQQSVIEKLKSPKIEIAHTMPKGQP